MTSEQENTLYGVITDAEALSLKLKGHDRYELDGILLRLKWLRESLEGPPPRPLDPTDDIVIPAGD